LARRNITEFEILALDAEINVADGHPRQELTDAQRDIVARFPELFMAAGRHHFEELETRAEKAFFSAVRQWQAPVGTDRILSAYASSVAMDVVARCLAKEAPKVALIHPTFDNIPDLLKAWSLELVPVEEDDLNPRAIERAGGRDLGCVFITTPNNPTGRVLGEESLGEIAEFCKARGLVLVLDTSFRGFDTRAQYDNYALLDGIGAEYVIIEDTGKLWPTSELKLGLLASSRRTRLDLRRAMSDILLSVSPFVLLLVEAFAQDAAMGGFERLHGLVEGNRELLRRELEDVECARVVDGGTRISVERIELDEGLSARAIWKELERESVHVLPCGPFHWARQPEGDRYLRIAIGREPETVERAARAIKRHLQTAGTLALQSSA
jgi:enduracididine biosynthesis enzyme MppP